ncbi:MAG: FAD-dependent oxidoreductase [Cyanobacteria bacterium P01_G01_bin.67]
MAKPTILTVDDDLAVLQAITRDLRNRYGDRFRIVRANSGASAIDTLEQLKVRNESVALFLTDQRMPGMNGVDFIEKAAPMFPKAKRVLLTAYADTDAAIKAINTARLDYYLLKPWDPPEEKLYPVLDDLLEDWLAIYRPGFEGIRVVGDRWSPCSHNIKDFLARNQVPYQWLDVETEPEAIKLIDYLSKEDKPKLPVVLFPDGERLEEPTNLEVAGKIGLQTHAEKPFYDLVIVGGGPAGLAAAVYGASEGLSTVMIERSAPGGQAGSSSRIENYLGFPVGLSGDDLARRGVTQARRFGVEILTPQEVVKITLKDPYRIVTLADGSEINCHAILIATGVNWRRLNLPGCNRLTGRGVYYGAAKTEAISCKNEHIYLVGGANSAGQAAMYFSKYAAKVTMLVRGDSLTKSMSQYLIEQIDATDNIEVQTQIEVVEARGEKSLKELTLLYNETGKTEQVKANFLFIFIGAKPVTEWLDGVVARDKVGYIYAGDDLKKCADFRGWNRDRDPFLLETSVPGIFVAGDIRYNSIKRVASAVGEGSIAIMFVHRYLAEIGA